MVTVGRERDLTQLILAGCAPRGFPGGLHRGQQQRDQDADDRNRDQQLHEREPDSDLESTALFSCLAGSRRVSGIHFAKFVWKIGGGRSNGIDNQYHYRGAAYFTTSATRVKGGHDGRRKG